MDRFVEQWGELTGLGEARRGPYVSSGLVIAGGARGRQVIELMHALRGAVDFERTLWRRNDPSYPFLYADQDVLNAILRTAIEPGDLIALDTRLAPTQPFSTLQLGSERWLHPVYPDGSEPILVHHVLPTKPWLQSGQGNVYTQLLSRALAPGLAIEVESDAIPLWLRRTRVGATRPTPDRRPRADSTGGSGSLPRPAGQGQTRPEPDRGIARMNDQPPAAFYCVSSRIYFLGAVAMINSLRLNGHREPIYLLDAGLSDAQRQLLAAEVTIVEAPSEAPPYLLKTVAPLAHPAEVMVLIDVDMIVCRSLGELIERAAEGRIVAFENNMDRFVEQWGELTGLGEARRGPYVSSGFVAAGSTVGAELLALVDRLQRTVELDLTVDFSRQDLPEHPFRYLDQDVLNAILRTAIEPGDLIALDTRLAPTQPFDGLRLFDASELRCAYRDGTEPYLLHHYLRKPWLEGVYHGVYSQFLARLLVGDELAITVPREQVPARMRSGPRARAERTLVNAIDLGRWYLGDRLPRRLRALRGHDAGNDP